MADRRLKDLRGPARRDFLRWIGAAGAAVAIERSKLLDFLFDHGGAALADEACAAANRSVHLVGGNGSFAWFQLLWPHIEVAESNNPQFAYHAYGDPLGFKWMGGERPMYYAPEAPWIDRSDPANPFPTRPVTAMMAGKDDTHTSTPDSAAVVGGGKSMLATVAAIQTANPTLVPVIGMDPLKFGAAPGAPAVATVPSAKGMIELFNSVSANLTLAAEQDKALFETYYKAFLGLRYAAGRPSWAPHVDTTKKAAKLIGFNFGAALTPTAEDLQKYGITTHQQSGASAVQKEKIENLGRAMITAAKALKLGLTNSVILGISPGPTSDTSFTDPHTTFANANATNAARATVKALGDILNAFYDDLKVPDPTCSGKTIDQSVVLTVHGDTPHNPLQGMGDWVDQTPKGANWIYVVGAGHLATGWFGGVRANGTVDGFDPTTGANMPNKPSVETSTAAGAAVAYAVAKGNMNTVSQFYAGPPITALIKPA